MSDICTVKKSTLDGIAEAIQNKTGESGGMLPSEMQGKIETLPSQPAKGLVFSEYDSDGYPHKAEFVGFTAIPPNYCARLFSNGQEDRNNIFKNFFNVVIPSEVVEIGVTAFYACAHLTSITLNEGLTKIGSYSLGQCYSLTSITLPTTIETFVGATFSENINMETVTFLGNVPSITNNCFRACTKVSLYDFSHATAVPSLYSVASLGHATDCVIKIPSALSDQTLGTGNGWESATNWSGLTNIVWEVV